MDQPRSTAQAWLDRWVATGRRSVWTAVFCVGYLTLYVSLDRISSIHGLYDLAIEPWNPSSGLAAALLIAVGPRGFPLVAAAAVVSALWVGILPPAAAIASALILTGTYTGAAIELRRAGFALPLNRTKDVASLIIVAVASSGVAATAVVGIYALFRPLPWFGYADAVLYYWVGDAISLLVMVPALLALLKLVDPAAPAESGPRWRRLTELAMQNITLLSAFIVQFAANTLGGQYQFFYLFFVPIVWIATRRGLAATSWALLAIQLALIVELRVLDEPASVIRTYQSLMFVLATTGLLLSAVVGERYRLLRALRDSEARRSAILNTARDGVVTTDHAGLIESSNPAAAQLFPIRGRLAGLNISDILKITPGQLAHMAETAARSSNHPAWELQARRADGSEFPVEVTIGRFAADHAERFTLVIRDISARKRVERQSRQHQAQEAQFGRISMAGEVAAGVAHELSQPLTAIAAFARGCLRILSQPAPATEELREGVWEVVREAERAGDVLFRLRELVRHGLVRPQPIAVRALIQSAVSLATIELGSEPVDIVVDVEPVLPPVMADQIQIEQVLLNLLRNANDAMAAAGTSTRRIAIAARYGRAGTVELLVQDNGPGISPEIRDRIFDPFVSSKPRGMGIGLSVSRTIVEAHGSTLRISNGSWPGACFLFDLPPAIPEQEHDAA